MKSGAGTGSKQIDDQRDSGNGQRNRGNLLRCEPLLAPRHHIEQHPHWRRVLHDDGGGNVGSLNRDVIEIIRDRYPERAQNEAVRQIAPRELDAAPSLRHHKQRKQHEQRKCGARLRKNERVNGTRHRPAQR